PASGFRLRPGLCRPGRLGPVEFVSRPSHPGRNQVAPPYRRKRYQPVAASVDEIRAGLAEILNEVADVDAADVSDEKSFTDDLDVDSLSMVEVAMAAEDKFGVKIPDDELPKLKTVGDAVSYIESNAG